MCHTNWKPDAYETEARTPGLRPVPQLKWVIPVDIVELGASLEARLKQRSQVKTLRLCHRFREGALSKLPQEILDYIISQTHQLEKAEILPKWYKALRCFQGRCTRGQHVYENSLQPEYLFNTMFVECWGGGYEGPPLDPQDYTEEETRDMVEDEIDENGYESWDDSVVERHWEEQDNWLDLVCQCENTAAGNQKDVRFPQLVDVSIICMYTCTADDVLTILQILKTQFGLDVVLLHEAFSENLVQFLPDVFGPSYASLDTAGFLTLATQSQPSPVSQARAETDKNGAFFKDGNHLAFHKTINLSDLSITEEQKLRFSRAMRILELKPYFHITELEDLIKPTNTADKSLWECCHRPLEGCPKPTAEARRVKRKKLEKYLQGKNEGKSALLISVSLANVSTQS